MFTKSLTFSSKEKYDNFQMKKREIKSKSFRNEECVPSTHCFVYLNKKYPFNFDIFKYSSKLMMDNEFEFSEIKEIKLFKDEDEISEAIPAETIECFIKYCHRETISIDETNVVFLNHLSKIYKVSTLEKYTDEYISDHAEELSIIILNFFNEKNEKIAAKYEEIVSSQLLKFIDDERLLNLGVSSLYRILSKYEFQRRMKNHEKPVKNDKEDEIELKIESFLFKCIEKFGKKASALFSIFSEMKRSSEIMKKLINDYSELFDIEFIPKSYVKNFFFDYSKRFEEQEKLINELKNENSINKKEITCQTDQLKQLSEKSNAQIDELNKRIDNIQKEKSKQEAKNKLQESVINELKAEISHLKEIISQYEEKENMKKIKKFSYQEGHELEGIINYLTNQIGGGNIHDKKLIEVTTNSCDRHPKNLLELKKENSYAANSGEKNFWVCFDFKNMEIELTNYSIKSYGCKNGNLKNWVIEISSDGEKWENVDERLNCDELYQSAVIKNFKVESSHFSRFCRLRHIGEFWEYDSSSTPGFRCIEFFGNLKE